MDDVFLLAKQDDLRELLKSAKFTCPSILFTMEFQTDCKLPFVDILVERIEKTDCEEILTCVYLKATF